MGFFDFLTQTVAVDIGSANLRIAFNDKLVFDQPTVISFDPLDKSTFGIGNHIIEEESHVTLRPVDITIGDFEAFELLLKGALKAGIPQKSWPPRSFMMYLSIPAASSTVDMRAYRDSAEHANGKDVYMVLQPVCAAIGMKILFKKKSFILIDIGASKVETTVFINSLPKVIGKSPFGIQKLRNVISNHIYRNYQINASDEEITTLLGVIPQHRSTCSIQEVNIPIEAINDLLFTYLRVIQIEITDTIELGKRQFDMTTVMMNPAYFTGGGSRISWIVNHIVENLDISVAKSEKPLLDVINGLSTIAQTPDTYKAYIMT